MSFNHLHSIQMKSNNKPITAIELIALKDTRDINGKKEIP